MTTIVCHVGVLMSDGSHFSGSLTENGSFTDISNDDLQTTRALTSGDNGASVVVVTAEQDSGSISAALELTVKATGTVQPPAPAKPTSVTLTPPSLSVLNTATAGAKLCSIAIAMSDGSSFSGAASENGAFTVISGTDLQLSRNLTAGDNGAVGVVVSATQNGGTATATFNLTVTAQPVVPPVSGDGTKFVKGVAAGGERWGNNGWMGMEFITGATGPNVPTEGVTSPLIVSALGRWVTAGNTGAHTLKIIDGATGQDVPGSVVTVNMAGKAPNAFTYATLASPVVLDIFHTYYFVSSEGGTDTLQSTGTNLTYSPVGFIFSGGEWGGGGWGRWGGYNTCNGPLDFIYTLGDHINVGSPLPQRTRTSYRNSFIVGEQGCSGILSGTVTIDGDWASDVTMPPRNSMTVQYYVDGKPASPYIKGPQNAPDRLGPNFPWVVNTTTHPMLNTAPDRTHHIVARFIDTDVSAGAAAAYDYGCYAGIFLVQNPVGTKVGDYSGAQLIPTGMVSTSQPYGATSTVPDFIKYPGTPQQMNTHARTPLKVPPSSDPKYRNYGELYIEDVSAAKAQEFVDTPVMATTPDHGGVFIDYTSVDTAGGSAELMYPFAFSSATRPGGRTNAFTTPLTTWIPAEGPDPKYGDDTGYMGIELGGGLFHMDWNGNETLLAGLAWDPAKLAFRNYYSHTFRDQILAQKQVKGTIVDPKFDLDDFGGLNDLCYDPRDYKVIYLCNIIYSFIIKVDRNFDPPRCSVYAGVPDSPGYVNGAAAAAKFAACSSIVMCDGSVSGFPAGTMLIADRDNACIRRISPDGNTVDTLCGNQTSRPTTGDLSDPGRSDTWSPDGSVGFTRGNDKTGAYINYPFTIRFLSNKSKLVFTECYTSTFRTIDLAVSTVTRIPKTKGIMAVSYSGWSWFDPDTKGVLGPVDDMVLAVGNGGINNMVYARVTPDGQIFGWIGDGTGRIGEGPGDQAGTVFAPMPVYAWASCFAKTRAHFIGGGFRYWGLYAARPKHPSDPKIDLGARIGINIDVFDKASAQQSGLWWNGTSMCFPLHSRPSFACLYGELGNGLLGSSIVPNFDDLAATYPTDGDFTAELCAPGTLGRYFQDGGAGTVQRRELTGKDLRAICYYVRRVSLSGTYPKAAEPGPEITDSTIPRISGVSATRISNDSMGNPRIQVTWTTDKRTIGMAMAGSAAQQATAYRYNCRSPIEDGFGTTHTAIVTGLPPSGPIHYCAIAKDVAGNSVYSDDQVLA